ncbi:hypothetical protein GOODEAATRI_009362, partial [Goodea atripinnis]
VGMTTDEIDFIVHQETIRHNAYPSPLGYGGFPKSVCTSVNNVVCHGIPDSRKLEDGDIINIDVTVRLCSVTRLKTKTHNANVDGKAHITYLSLFGIGVFGRLPWSAQFEHTVVITAEGAKILTKLPEEDNL